MDDVVVVVVQCTAMKMMMVYNSIKWYTIDNMVVYNISQKDI